MKKLFLCLLTAALLLSFTGCSRTARSKTWYVYFDTVTEVIAYDSAKDFDRACLIIEDLLKEYHQLCDIYYEYSGINNLCTLNRSGGPVRLDEKLIELLEYGQQIYCITGGACNIAMGAVLSQWHDCREQAAAGNPSLPDPEALRLAAEYCRIEDLQIDKAAGTVTLAAPQMSLDLGALAKGYAAEIIAQALETAGFSGYALSLGGNVRVIGEKPGGEAWISGIQDPSGQVPYLMTVPLKDRALVTSGSYQRYFDYEGRRYHHIIDPETLYPENEYLSVTILAPDSSMADALSTALFNLSIEEGLSILRGFPGAEACWILADGSIRMSNNFPGKVVGT